MAFCANPLHLGMQFENWLVYDPVPEAPNSFVSVAQSPLDNAFGQIYDVRAMTGPRLDFEELENYWAAYLELLQKAQVQVRRVLHRISEIPGWENRVGAAAIHLRTQSISCIRQVLWIAQLMLMERGWYHPDTRPRVSSASLYEFREPYTFPPQLPNAEDGAKLKPDELFMQDYFCQCPRWGAAINCVVEESQKHPRGLFGILPKAILDSILQQCSWVDWYETPKESRGKHGENWMNWLSVEKRSPHLWPPTNMESAGGAN